MKLILGSWNVRTLLDVNNNLPRRRTALVAKELEHYNIDIAALAETRFESAGNRNEQGYRIYWSECSPLHKGTSGVGFAVSMNMLKKWLVEPTPRAVSDRIMCLRIPITATRFATLVSVYAPTLQVSQEQKELFYGQLRDALRQVPQEDKLFVLGDFNARVGGDHDAWDKVLGQFGRGNCNTNGELLLSLCTELGLAVTNSFLICLTSGTTRGNIHVRSTGTFSITCLLVGATYLMCVKHVR